MLQALEYCALPLQMILVPLFHSEQEAAAALHSEINSFDVQTLGRISRHLKSPAGINIDQIFPFIDQR